MGNSSDKPCSENQNTHSIFNNFFFFENFDLYVIKWKNAVDPGRPQMTIWGMHIACYISKTTKTL
jgi:hypothetical protein